jgi:predicted nucleic acid-binding protein
MRGRPPDDKGDRRVSTLTNAQLEQMSIKALRELRDRVDEATKVAVDREKAEVKAQIMAVLAEHGLSVTELLDDSAPNKLQSETAGKAAR